MFTGNYLSHKPEDHSLFASHSQEFTPGAVEKGCWLWGNFIRVAPQIHLLSPGGAPGTWNSSGEPLQNQGLSNRGVWKTLEWISVWVGALKGIFSAKRFEKHGILVDWFWWALCFWSPDTSWTWQFQMNYTAVETRLERHAVSKWDLQIEHDLNGWPVEIQVLFPQSWLPKTCFPRPENFSISARPILLYDIPDGHLVPIWLMDSRARGKRTQQTKDFLYSSNKTNIEIEDPPFQNVLPTENEGMFCQLSVDLMIASRIARMASAVPLGNELIIHPAAWNQWWSKR